MVGPLICFRGYLCAQHVMNTTQISTIHRAALHDDVGALLAELNKGVSVDLVSDQGFSALHLAATSSPAAVECLLQRKANARLKTVNGETALHLACKSGRADIAAVLIDHSADINSAEESGWTPLMAAVHAYQLSSIKVLLHRKADAGVQTTKSESALTIAKEKTLDDVVALLQNCNTRADSPARAAGGSRHGASR